VARPTVSDVEKALAKFRATDTGIKKTPLIHSRYLSEVAGCDVFLKLENLQTTGSYKVRGAYNMLTELSDEQRARGIITASAGNHAQGVAFAAAKLGMTETTHIVMAKNASRQKLSRTQKYGVNIDQEGSSYDEAKKHAEQRAAKERLVYVPAFDHWDVICGQGTVALEIMEECPNASTIIVPVGGGGLMAGCVLATETRTPKVRILGVEATAAAPFAFSFSKKRRQQLPRPARTLADGIQVREPGEHTWEVIQPLGEDSILTVADRFIGVAMNQLAEYEQLIAEGAGAAGVAALITGRIRGLGKKDAVVIVVSGGNIETRVYQHVVNYVLHPPSLLFEFRVMIGDNPGHLVNLLQPLWKKGINVVSVDVLRWHPGSLRNVSDSLISVVVELPDTISAEEVVATLEAESYHIQAVPSFIDAEEPAE
jgi:threonine dehydratase